MRGRQGNRVYKVYRVTRVSRFFTFIPCLPCLPCVPCLLCILGLLLLTSCQPTNQSPQTNLQSPISNPQSPIPSAASPTGGNHQSPITPRPNYSPGQIVDYTAQTGDTLPSLAIHFNTTVDEILEANPIIPEDATTLPPGLPMQIPIYFVPFWGSQFQILPDSLFVHGPALVGFDTQEFVNNQPGWLKDYRAYAAGENRSGAEIVDYVATNFSLSPRVLLALLDYQTGALSQASMPRDVDEDYPLDYQARSHRGLYMQLVWAANTLNNGYYGYRTGRLTTLDFQDGTMEHPDPWQNAATVSLQYYFSLDSTRIMFDYVAGPDGFALTYQNLFGDPWADVQPHIPGSLQQPDMRLPFEPGKTWAYTGGPHTGWGTGDPRAAIDFAPPAVVGGCIPSSEWVTSVAGGVVARSETGIIELDLDGDGDLRTGWVVFYLHVATRDRVPAGKVLEAGDPLGHPSCEGGTSTGTHIHIVRKYNGEWIPADGPLAFTLEGWITHNGDKPYQGTLTRFSQTVTASANATKECMITAAEQE